MGHHASLRWKRLFPTWFAPFLSCFRHQAQRRWAPVYIRGLCSTAHRKSIAPLAERVAPGQADQLQNFITDSPWEMAPLLRLLAQQANTLLGGKQAVLIIDDTCLTKFGKHSVGVARQYSGQVGKVTNCQCLVSLTLAKDELPIPLALRLFLPSEWTEDPARCLRAGVPPANTVPQTKWALALEELDRVRKDVDFGVVLADAGYGNNADFRKALSRRGLLWSVGIVKTQKVYPEDVRVTPAPQRARGRPPKYPVTSVERQTVEQVLSNVPWQKIVWRQGSKGPLQGRFAAAFVRIAHGVRTAPGVHLPREEVWILGEERAGGEKKYSACNLPPSTALTTLVEIMKRRWACEHAHREFKQEVGLSHFEGRTWRGLCHHATLCLLALGFLQSLRLTQRDEVFGATVPAIREELAGALPRSVVCPRCLVVAAHPAGP